MSNYMKQITEELTALEQERADYLTKLEEIDKKIESLKKANDFFQTHIFSCFEIPERVKTYLGYYAFANKINPLKVYNIYEMGRKKVRSIYGIGRWSIVDLDKFFSSHGYEWFD